MVDQDKRDDSADVAGSFRSLGLEDGHVNLLRYSIR